MTLIHRRQHSSLCGTNNLKVRVTRGINLFDNPAVSLLDAQDFPDDREACRNPDDIVLVYAAEETLLEHGNSIAPTRQRMWLNLQQSRMTALLNQPSLRRLPWL